MSSAHIRPVTPASADAVSEQLVAPGVNATEVNATQMNTAGQGDAAATLTQTSATPQPPLTAQPSQSPFPPTPPQTPQPPSGSSYRSWLVPVLMGLVVLLILLVLVERNRIDRIQADVARRLAQADVQAKDAVNNAQRAEGTTRDVNARLQAMELRLAESQSQQAALENLYQDLARNRDDTVLIEVEQTVNLAAQQLQLSANVAAAIAALQAAEARLARADKQAFAPVRRAVLRDLEKLRALPDVNIAANAAVLDGLLLDVDQLALLTDNPSNHETGPLTPTSQLSWWQRLRADVWNEFKSLVRVRRANNSEAMFVTPEQAWIVRENMKLRLLNARLALVGRQETSFRADIAALEATLARYFDPGNRNVRNAREQLAQLQTAAVAIQLPTLSESQSAVRQARARGDSTRETAREPVRDLNARPGRGN